MLEAASFGVDTAPKLNAGVLVVLVLLLLVKADGAAVAPKLNPPAAVGAEPEPNRLPGFGVEVVGSVSEGFEIEPKLNADGAGFGSVADAAGAVVPNENAGLSVDAVEEAVAPNDSFGASFVVSLAPNEKPVTAGFAAAVAEPNENAGFSVLPVVDAVAVAGAPAPKLKPEEAGLAGSSFLASEPNANAGFELPPNENAGCLGSPAFDSSLDVLSCCLEPNRGVDVEPKEKAGFVVSPNENAGFGGSSFELACSVSVALEPKLSDG